MRSAILVRAAIAARAEVAAAYEAVVSTAEQLRADAEASAYEHMHATLAHLRRVRAREARLLRAVQRASFKPSELPPRPDPALGKRGQP